MEELGGYLHGRGEWGTSTNHTPKTLPFDCPKELIIKNLQNQNYVDHCSIFEPLLEIYLDFGGLPVLVGKWRHLRLSNYSLNTNFGIQKAVQS